MHSGITSGLDCGTQRKVVYTGGLSFASGYVDFQRLQMQAHKSTDLEAWQKWVDIIILPPPT